jgi:hypothetical protein
MKTINANIITTLTQYSGIRSFYKKFPDATALYGTQNLNDPKSAVLRARRSIDNSELDFTARELTNGTLLDWVVPTDVQALYGERMYFDGSNDYISMSQISIFNDATNSFKIKVKCIPTGVTGVRRIVAQQYVSSGYKGVSLYSSGSILYLDIINHAGTQQLTVRANGLTLLPDILYDIEVAYTGTKSAAGVSFVVNGTTYSGVATTSNLTLNDINADVGFVVGRDSSSRLFNGPIWDVEIYDGSNTLLHRWGGYGNTNSDWEDQVGSNDGTVVGSPDLFTGQGFNAFVPTLYDQRVSNVQDRMYFDGSLAPYIPYSPTLQLLDGGAIEFYIFAEGTNVYDGLINRYEGTDTGYSYLLTYGKLRFRLQGINTLTSENNFFDTTAQGIDIRGAEHKTKVKWYTIDNNTTIKLYIDDEEIYSETKNNFIMTSSIDKDTDIGHRSTAFKLKGYIRDLKFYDKNDNVITHIPFYGNSSEDIEDQVGSNNAVIVGTANRCTKELVIANDAVQETSANQPFIVKDGSLVTKDGLPGIGVYSVAGVGLGIANFENIFDSDNFTSIVVSYQASSGPAIALSRISDDSRWYSAYQSSGTEYFGYGDSASKIELGTVTGERTLISAFANATTCTAYRNGTLGGSTASIDGYAANNPEIGNLSGLPFEGVIQEVVLFVGDKTTDREKIEKSINKRWRIF